MSESVDPCEPARVPLVVPATLASAKNKERLDSVDLLRGLVMVIMALDHVRDFVSNAHFDPTDLDRTTSALFATRFITHYCAPVFVFLAGTGAFISMARGKPKKELARFLLTRGLWLVLLEITVVRFGWSFTFDLHFFGLQVIWVLGWCMVFMAGIVFLPLRAIAVFGIATIVLHNLADSIHAKALGAWAPLWSYLHEFGIVALPNGTRIVIVYPLVPWIGVMAAGYAFGELLIVDPVRRRRRLAILGGALTLGFVVLRLANVYGDPHPWVPQPTTARSIMAFLACEKYPPSLAYLLMTLGPAILALAAFDGVKSTLARPFIAFGRVPLFYYVLHLPLIHVTAMVLAYFVYGHFVPQLVEGPFTGDLPKDYGYALPSVYAVWIACVLLLYPACRWFAGVKARRRDAWLSYL